jgi:4-amino-4-deoxy-L-arabinose transferase-like glycosyltransferase
MADNLKKYFLGAVATLVAYVILWKTWIVHSQLFLSGVVAAVALGLIIFLNREDATPSAEAGPTPSALADSKPALRGAGGWLMAAAGLAFISVAFEAAMAAKWGVVIFGLISAALAWSPLVSKRPQVLPKSWEKTLLVLLLLGASCLRLYKAGDLPVGMITPDESLIMIQARAIAEGARPSFATDFGLADGAVNFYFQAFTMKIFGSTVFGFRMDGILIGILLAWVLYLLGREFGGPRLGLYAAGFISVCVWPVVVSRSHYLLNETLLLFLLYIYFYFMGLKKNSSFYFALSGFLFGMSFNTYKSSQVGAALMPLLIVFIYTMHKDQRRALIRGLMPLLMGTLLGLAPLALWALHDPKLAYQQYFYSLSAEHIVGGGIVRMGFLQKMDMVLSRTLPLLPVFFKVFTTSGPLHPWFFNTDQPILEKLTLFFFLAGFVVCLIRARNAPYAFLILWWFIGLFPALVAAPGTTLNERRSITSMPAMMLMAGLGLMVVQDLMTRILNEKNRNLLALLVAALLFTTIGVGSWDRFFHGINESLQFLNFSRANSAAFARAIHDENRKKPVYVISTWRSNTDSWTTPNPDSYQISYWAIAPGQPTYWAESGPEYYTQEGLINAIRQLPIAGPNEVQRDLLFALTPFHFYLESMLLNELGGTVVREIEMAKSKEGYSTAGLPMARDPRLSMKLIRVPPVSPAAIEKIRKRYHYEYEVDELDSPSSLGGRGVLIANSAFSAMNLGALENYEKNPDRWKALRNAKFWMPDPYFWSTTGILPGNMQCPLRLRATWRVMIPASGKYAFGASSSMYIHLNVDGKRVFRFLPTSSTMSESSRDGLLGNAIQLSAGSHRLEVEQVMMSNGDCFNQLIRLFWQAPGKEKEVLPLAYLLPRNPSPEAK